MFGDMKASELLKREKFLEGVISAVNLIKNEISYCKTPLYSLFEELNRRKEFNGLLIFDLPQDEKTGIGFAFEKRIKGLKARLCINDDDLAVLIGFVSSIENADEDAALSLCMRTSELLRQSAVRAHEKSVKNARLYRTLGLFAGIGAAMFFI